MTLACEDANSKLVDDLTVAVVDDEGHVEAEVWEQVFFIPDICQF